jgi:hypothetical protein
MNSSLDKYVGRLHHVSPANRAEIWRVLNTDRGRATAFFADTFADKIAYDISFIIKQGWAERLSNDDFFHGHAYVRRRIPLGGEYISDLMTIISTEHVDLHYHTKELVLPRGDEWNIYAPATGDPLVIPPEKNVRGLMFLHFNFVPDGQGPQSIETRDGLVSIALSYTLR